MGSASEKRIGAAAVDRDPKRFGKAGTVQSLSRKPTLPYSKPSYATPLRGSKANQNKDIDSGMGGAKTARSGTGRSAAPRQAPVRCSTARSVTNRDLPQPQDESTKQQNPADPKSKNPNAFRKFLNKVTLRKKQNTNESQNDSTNKKKNDYPLKC